MVRTAQQTLKSEVQGSEEVQSLAQRMRENPKVNPGRQPCRENKHERKPYSKSNETTLLRKQAWKKTLRQIQGDNPAVKTSMGEKPKANLGDNL
jgi:hypothetical protein